MAKSVTASRALCAAALFCAAICPRVAVAEEPLARVGFEYIPATGLKEPPPGLEDVEFIFTTVTVDAKYPVALGDGGAMVLPGIRYRLVLPSQDRGQGAGAPADFHEAYASFTLVQPLSKRWMLSANFSPGLATTFEDLDNDHIRVNGALLARIAFNEKVALGFGLLLNYQFGDLLPLPAIQLDWRPTSKFKLNLFVPRGLHAAFLPIERFEIGLRAQIDGNRFIIREDAGPTDNLKYSLVDAGLDVAVRVAGPIWLNAYGGYALSRRFEVFDAADTKIADLDLDPSPLVRFGIEFRPPPRKPAARAPEESAPLPEE